MPDAQRMTEAETHDFGVPIVVGQLRKEGYEIASVNTGLGMKPQIVGRKDNQLAFIAVRTACYPEKGRLDGPVHLQIIEHADKHGAIPYSASVGIADADAKTEAEMGIPVGAAGFHVAYGGMVVIARSD
jgi:hypothetical protein